MISICHLVYTQSFLAFRTYAYWIIKNYIVAGIYFSEWGCDILQTCVPLLMISILQLLKVVSWLWFSCKQNLTKLKKQSYMRVQRFVKQKKFKFTYPKKQNLKFVYETTTKIAYFPFSFFISCLPYFIVDVTSQS